MKPKSIFGLLKDTFTEWREDKASRLGAALAYYAIFSIGPLILVAIAIAGFVFGEEAASGQIEQSLGGVLGPEGAAVIEQSVANAAKPGAGIVASVLGIVTLLLGASGIFGQLQDALNTVWDAEPEEGGGIVGFIKTKLTLFVMVLVVGLLLLATLAANAVLSVIGKAFSDLLPGGALVWQVVNFLARYDDPRLRPDLQVPTRHRNRLEGRLDRGRYNLHSLYTRPDRPQLLLGSERRRLAVRCGRLAGHSARLDLLLGADPPVRSGVHTGLREGARLSISGSEESRGPGVGGRKALPLVPSAK
jgi:hypothetical protein